MAQSAKIYSHDDVFLTPGIYIVEIDGFVRSLGISAHKVRYRKNQYANNIIFKAIISLLIIIISKTI